MHRLGQLGVALLFAAIPTAVLLAMNYPFAAVGVAVFTVSTCRLPDEAEAIPVVGHRTVTHTVLFAFGVAVIASLGVAGLFLAGRDTLPISRIAYLSIPVGATLGILSHLAADAVTVGRGDFTIEPFWPANERTVRLGFCKSGNTVANAGLLLIGGLTFDTCLYFGLRTLAPG